MRFVTRLSLFLLCTLGAAAWTPAGNAATHQAAEEPSQESGEKTSPHAPGEPPIDCPLAKHGVHPGHLRPFEEVEEYIAFLERPDRAQWQRPDAVISALALSGDETVSDVGAGSGYFSFRLAEALPHGNVRAIDVEPEMIRHIHHKAMSNSIRNVEAVLTDPDDPQVSPDSDLVLVVDVLHHVEDRLPWLRRIHETLRPGARLALIEFREGELPVGPPKAMKIPKPELTRMMEQAGFRLQEDHDELLPYQCFLVFVKPAA
jgi:SAM-dependent methyltransferase